MFVTESRKNFYVSNTNQTYKKKNKKKKYTDKEISKKKTKLKNKQ